MEWNDTIKNPKEEELELKKIIKKNPRCAEAYYRLAVIYEYLGERHNLLKAIRYCKKAVLLEPSSKIYLAFFIYLNINFDDKKAIDALVKFIGLQPDEQDYYTQRVMEKVKYIDRDFILEYIQNLNKQGKYNITRTIKRWLEIT